MVYGHLATDACACCQLGIILTLPEGVWQVDLNLSLEWSCYPLDAASALASP
jgi:hypothetical protein